MKATYLIFILVAVIIIGALNYYFNSRTLPPLFAVNGNPPVTSPQPARGGPQPG